MKKIILAIAFLVSCNAHSAPTNTPAPTLFSIVVTTNGVLTNSPSTNLFLNNSNLLNAVVNTNPLNARIQTTALEATNYAAGLAQPDRLFNLSKWLHGGSNNLPVILYGDSMMTGRILPLRSLFRDAFGPAGYGFGGGLFAASTNGLVATVSNGFTNWVNGIYYDVAAGGRVTNSYNTTDPVLANKFSVYYVKQPGAGTFKIQSSLNGAAYADVSGFTSVDASNGSITAGIANFNLPTGRYRIVVECLTGSFKFIGASAQDTNTFGAVLYSFAQSGIALDSMGTVAPAIFTNILTNINPALVLFEMKETPTIFTNNLASNETLFRGGSTNSAWIYIAANPETNAAADALQVTQNEFLKNYCRTNNRYCHDDYFTFISGEAMLAYGMTTDGVHPTAAGFSFSCARIFQNISLGFSTEQNPFNSSWKMIGDYAVDISQKGGVWNPTGSAGFALRGDTNSSKLFEFLTDDGYSQASIQVNEADTGANPNALQISLKSGPSLVMSAEGIPSAIRHGFNAHTAAPGSYYEGIGGNPGYKLMSLAAPSSQTADVQDWLVGSQVVARVSAGGSLVVTNNGRNTTLTSTNISTGTNAADYFTGNGGGLTNLANAPVIVAGANVTITKTTNTTTGQITNEVASSGGGGGSGIATQDGRGTNTVLINATFTNLTTFRGGYQVPFAEISADGFVITSNHCVLLVNEFAPTADVDFPVNGVTNGFRLEFLAGNNAFLGLTNTIGLIFLKDSTSSSSQYQIDEANEVRGAVFTKYGTNWYQQQN